ncbi:MAG: type I secretion C-terminal target domain-containing protein, partial [Rhodocyclales bacterium]|nr:type I secretion C-terminal target domain-containing protein [Rhodocyclales bacterium]
VTTHDANATTQTIVLSGVNLVGAYTTDAQIIQNLLNNNKLITD